MSDSTRLSGHIIVGISNSRNAVGCRLYGLSINNRTRNFSITRGNSRSFGNNIRQRRNGFVANTQAIG
ncbi:MAG: hypothetical protein OXD01_07605, partial [Gammaproteobacteria bacterium]|nr:hypothetical protein [Gammaproteobacteria bacterium]